VLLIRAAQAAESIGDYGLAGDFWARSSKTPTWYDDKIKELKSAVTDFVKDGRYGAAAEQLIVLDDMGAGQNGLAAEVRQTTPKTDYQAGLFAELGGDTIGARQAYRRYVDAAPNGEFAAGARRHLNDLNGVTTHDDASGWNAVQEIGTAQAYQI